MAGRRSTAKRPALPQNRQQRRSGQAARRVPHRKPCAAPSNETGFADVTRRDEPKASALHRAVDHIAGRRNAAELNPGDITAICLELAGTSVSYRHILHAALARLLNEQGRADLTVRIPRLPAPQPKETTVPEAEFERVLRCAPPALELCLLLAHEAGLRSQAAVTLTRANCDFDNDRLTGKTKGGALYDLPMTRRLKDRLYWFCAAAADSQEPLTATFRPHRATFTLNSLRKAICEARARARVPSIWGMHDLRRTAARRLYAATRDIRKVQAFLGHRMLWTTCWYLGNGLQSLTAADLEEATTQNRTDSTERRFA